jgi:hypothetical protein
MPRNPGSPIEALWLSDRSLAWSLPMWSKARARLEGLQHGLSGRPAGSGVPGGGSGGVSTSVVERCVLGAGRAERDELVRLVELPCRIESSVLELVARLRADGQIPAGPEGSNPWQRLAWSRWAIRTVVGLYAAGAVARSLPRRPVTRLYAQATELEYLIRAHTDPPHRPSSDVKKQTTEPKREPSKWCTIHLRIGAFHPISDRYPTDEVCRWCGDFRAAEGYEPSRDLLEAHDAGKRITQAMVKAARPVKKRKRRR